MKVCPPGGNVEAICHFLNAIGKQMDDESTNLRRINDEYFGRLKELASDLQLAPGLRVIVSLRANNWVWPQGRSRMGT